MRPNVAPNGNEISFDDSEVIVSKTDPTGKLTYGNRVFFRMCHMGPRQCIGEQHNIIRHPGMPRVVFDLLWDTIQEGQEIFAFVNNLAANGDNYWVFAHVTPSYNQDGEIIGYHSSRRTPNRKALDDHIKPLYEALHEIEDNASSPKEGMHQARDEVSKLLAAKGMEFNEFMFSLREA
ncbi:MAG: chemotaxis protein [Alphaproteobacteria bacterium]|nr:chemotaxis protein [Alphaproteobacteria bacterium]